MNKINKDKTLLINSDWFYLILLIIIFNIFFFRLFFPQPKTFITPDVYLSDQLHLNYSLKNILSQSLKNNTLPWWNQNIAGGYPLIGESQIGVFYLPNLILFKFLPFEYAFNLGYVFSFIICAVGCYLFFKEFIRYKFIAFLGSLYFTFSAVFFIQIIHYNALQAYSLIPIIFYLTQKLITSRNKKGFFILLLFAYSQQYFAGYAMTNLICSICVFIYIAIITTAFHKKNKLNQLYKIIKYCLFFHLLIIPLISVQLIPQIEFALQSTRSQGTGIGAFLGSFYPIFFLTYLNFYALGMPNQSNFSNNLVYRQYRNMIWENNMYLGIIPIIIFIVGFFYLKKNKDTILKKFYLLVIIFIIISLGINTPLYVLFTLPPFNFFRTPFRFMIVTNIFIVVAFIRLFSSLFNKLRKNKFFIGILVALCFIDIFFLANLLWQYHPKDSFKNINKSNTAQFLLNNRSQDLLDNDYKIYQIGDELIWNELMVCEGFSNIDKYKFLMNNLSAYFNVIYDIPSANVFSGSMYCPKNYDKVRKKLKNTFYSKLIDTEFADQIESKNCIESLKYLFNNDITLNTEFIENLQLQNIKYLITPFKIKDTAYIKKIYEEMRAFDINYYVRIYELSNPKPRFYFSDANSGDAGQIKVVENQPTETKIITISAINTTLISSDSVYPGWNVYVDGKKTNIDLIDFQLKTVPVPVGSHDIVFRYEPWWYLPALSLTIIFNMLLLIYLLYLSKK